MPSQSVRLLWVLPLLLAGFNPRTSLSATASARVSFSRDILPILSDNCYHCHGPDEEKRKAKLRFDTKEGAFRIKEGKAVIVPGHSDRSELIRRVTATDPDEVMPPPKSNRKLTPKQIALLKSWVEEGANWSQHWAFVPPKRPEVPRTGNQRWAHNGIDAFVLAQL